MSWENDGRVALNACADYNEVEACIRKQFDALGIGVDTLRGKKVVIKPNLVAPYQPDRAITTHPALTEAAAKIIKESGGDVLIAESPGGFYAEAALKTAYRVTGTASAAEKAGVPLNYDLSYRAMQAPKGEASKMFEIIAPILDADIIVDICKLKTHTLTQLSANAKNLFGCVPGVFKAEQHARFPNQTEFMRAIVDLAQAICDLKPMICITDAVIGMEGNGPSGGTPRAIGCVMTSLNPFAADIVCAHIVCQDGKVKMLEFANKRGLCPDGLSGVTVLGDSPDSFVIKNYVQPDTSLSVWFDRIPSWLSPRPQVDFSKCVGCGKCAENCPPHVITMVKTDNKKRPMIARKNCIHCFCCQELCPIHAISVHKNFLFRFFK